jgi:hypothetical protein
MNVGTSRSLVAGTALFLAGLVAPICLSSAGAADGAQLKVMAGAPAERGRWRMSFDKGAGGGGTSLAGRTMSVCIDAGREMAKGLGQSADPGRCTFRVVEDSASRGVIETLCDGKTTRSSITREGPKSFRFSTTTSGKDGLSLAGLYTYEGPCSADGPVILADKNSPECRQAKAQLASLDPAKACGSLTGTARASCEEQVRKAHRTLAATCQ